MRNTLLPPGVASPVAGGCVVSEASEGRNSATASLRRSSTGSEPSARPSVALRSSWR